MNNLEQKPQSCQTDVSGSYVVFQDGASEGVEGLVQLSITLPTLEGARNYVKHWKDRKLYIYKLVE